jgi:hypothetical protein
MIQITITLETGIHGKKPTLQVNQTILGTTNKVEQKLADAIDDFTFRVMNAANGGKPEKITDIRYDQPPGIITDEKD